MLKLSVFCGAGVLRVEFQQFIFEDLAHPVTPKAARAFIFSDLLTDFGFNLTQQVSFSGRFSSSPYTSP